MCSFLPASDVAQAKDLLASETGFEVRPVQLRDFYMQPVVGCYFKQYRRARRAADTLAEAGLNPLEADINPAERFLMERFIAGAAELRGEPLRRGRSLSLENPAIRASDYLPALKVVSFDIETAMSGVSLYSIGVHGVSAQCEERLVFMIGDVAEREFMRMVPDEAALLQAFLGLGRGLGPRRADRLECHQLRYPLFTESG